MLARSAMLDLNYGAPQAAAARAEQARHVAGTRPTAAATLAAAVAARAYAVAHQPDQARSVLVTADAYMECLDAGARADASLTHGEQKHHVHLHRDLPTRPRTTSHSYRPANGEKVVLCGANTNPPTLMQP
ncbi:hypothetical protein [Streptomyces lavendulocolor]|uniref:hypothetical protein n=1 Tax=Streptomyces lavendulocolor TaxID=67316 RepID=UPI003C30C2C5